MKTKSKINLYQVKEGADSYMVLAKSMEEALEIARRVQNFDPTDVALIAQAEEILGFLNRGDDEKE